jgi:hypothetical protein
MTTRLAERSAAKSLAYWSFTGVIVTESLIGGTMDLLRLAPFAKIIAAVILLAPGLPRLKEWAYAGIMINMIGAAASNAATHQPIGSLLTPLVFAAIAMLSWALRPAPRRLSSME